MGRNVGAVLDGLAVLVVEFVGAQEHFFVGLCRLEPKFFLDFGGVEYEGACNHLVLVGAQGRNAELACNLHAGDDEPFGEMGQLGFRFAAMDNVTVDFVEGLYVV